MVVMMSHLGALSQTAQRLTRPGAPPLLAGFNYRCVYVGSGLELSLVSETGGRPGERRALGGACQCRRGDNHMRPAGSPNRSIRSRDTLYHVTYLWILEVSGLVTRGSYSMVSECHEPRGSGVMKTIMRPRPAGHGLPWSGQRSAGHIGRVQPCNSISLAFGACSLRAGKLCMRPRESACRYLDVAVVEVRQQITLIAPTAPQVSGMGQPGPRKCVLQAN